MCHNFKRPTDLVWLQSDGQLPVIPFQRYLLYIFSKHAIQGG